MREGDADAVLAGAGAQIVVHRDLDASLGQALRGAAATVAVEERLAEAGLSAREQEEALAAPAVAVRALEPDEGGAGGVAFVTALLLYGQLVGFGVWVANGIAEEKSSRVVELLLGAIRSTQLLAGKVLGIGVLGLVQLLGIAAAGLALAVGLGAVELDGDTLRGIGAALTFFVFGYALYAAMFAVAGALVSRQEDVQATTTPLIVVLVASFFVALQALQDPTSALASIASYVPLSSPMVMPSRLITGDAGPAEAALAIVLLVAGAAVLLAVAARVYDNAVLRMGARVPLRAALAGRR